MYVDKLIASLDNLTHQIQPLSHIIDFVVNKFAPKITVHAGCLGFPCRTTSWWQEKCINGVTHDCLYIRDYFDGPMYGYCGQCMQTYTATCVSRHTSC